MYAKLQTTPAEAPGPAGPWMCAMVALMEPERDMVTLTLPVVSLRRTEAMPVAVAVGTPAWRPLRTAMPTFDVAICSEEEERAAGVRHGM